MDPTRSLLTATWKRKNPRYEVAVIGSSTI